MKITLALDEDQRPVSCSQLHAGGCVSLVLLAKRKDLPSACTEFRSGLH